VARVCHGVFFARRVQQKRSADMPSRVSSRARIVVSSTDVLGVASASLGADDLLLDEVEARGALISF
jgi:hypothetical protein